jgi:hypothetical protein
MHECTNQIVHYHFVQTGHLVSELLELLVEHIFCKVTRWQFCSFIHNHILQILYKLYIYIYIYIYYGYSKLENNAKYIMVMHLQESYDHPIAYNENTKSPNVVSFCFHLNNPKPQGSDSQGRLN